MSSTVFYLLRLAMGMLIVVAGFVSASFADDDAESLFTVGSKAPPLEIEHWMSDGDGEYEHTTELKSDKIYMIEFWATWCGPCIVSMPHLAEIQEKWGDQGLQIISVSVEDLETVEEFLKRKVRGKEGMTYGQLTSKYCLTTDPDRSVYEDYFKAAGQTGIPTAFIVGKEGVVEWIGHPHNVDEPIEQIIAGTWDREKFGAEFKEEQKRKAQMMRVQLKLNKQITKIVAKLKAGESDEGLEMLDQLMDDEEFAVVKPKLENVRQQLVMMYVGGDKGVAVLNSIVEENKDNAAMLNRVAWSLYVKHKKNPLDEKMLAAATATAEAGVKAAPDNSLILDTLSHLLHASGNLDRAIEIQEKAVANLKDKQSDGTREEFMKELKEERAEQDE